MPGAFLRIVSCLVYLLGARKSLFRWYGFRTRGFLHILLSHTFQSHFHICLLAPNGSPWCGNGYFLCGASPWLSGSFLSILSVLVQDVKRLDVWFRIPVCLKENVRTFGIKRTDIFIVMKKEGCPYGASLLQYDGNWIIS